VRRPERCPVGIYHDNGFTRSRLAAIQDVAGENPRVPGCDAVSPFLVYPDGVQDPSLTAPHRFQPRDTIFGGRMRRKQTHHTLAREGLYDKQVRGRRIHILHRNPLGPAL